MNLKELSDSVWSWFVGALIILFIIGVVLAVFTFSFLLLAFVLGVVLLLLCSVIIIAIPYMFGTATINYMRRRGWLK